MMMKIKILYLTILEKQLVNSVFIEEELSMSDDTETTPLDPMLAALLLSFAQRYSIRRCSVPKPHMNTVLF